MRFKPSPQEALLLWRRRVGLSQAQAGAFLGCGRTTYSRMEAGERPIWDHDLDERFEPPMDPPPRPQELLFLLRRRSSLTLDGLAEALGVSRPTALKWEGLADDRLVKFWRNSAK